MFYTQTFISSALYLEIKFIAVEFLTSIILVPTKLKFLSAKYLVWYPSFWTGKSKKKGCQDDKTMSEAGNVIFSSCRDQMSLFLVLSDERGNKLENK